LTWRQVGRILATLWARGRVGDGAGPGPPSLTGEPDPHPIPTPGRLERVWIMKRSKLEGFESAADLATVGLIIALGLAMVVGLLTASGSVTWQ